MPDWLLPDDDQTYEELEKNAEDAIYDLSEKLEDNRLDDVEQERIETKKNINKNTYNKDKALLESNNNQTNNNNSNVNNANNNIVLTNNQNSAPSPVSIPSSDFDYCYYDFF